MVCEDWLIGRPVVLRLRVDTRTRLHDYMAAIYGTDFSLNAIPRFKGASASSSVLARIDSVGKGERDKKD